MAKTNISTTVETLPPQMDQDWASDDLTTYRRILELGSNDRNISARNELRDILKYGYDNSHEKDDEFRAMLDNRYQYALNSVIHAIAETPEDLLPGVNHSFFRRNALEVLNESYSFVLNNDPQGAARIAYSLTMKLDNPNEGTMRMMSANSQTETSLSNETYQVLKLIEAITDNVGNQSHEISINVFDAIIRNLKYTEDSHVYCEEVGYIGKFLSKSIQLQNWELYTMLVDTFYNRMEALDINKPEDYRVLNNISSIYSQLLSNSKGYTRSEERLKINKKIFNKSLSMVQDCKDDRIRADFIYPLETAVVKEKEGRRKWENDPKILKQQIAFHSRTLRALINVTNKQEEITGDYLHDATPYLHYTTYRLLGRMLEEYINGVRYKDENWDIVSKRYHTLYKEGLRVFLNGIDRGNKDISEKIIDQLKDFLSPSLLEDPKHPFIKEGAEFYVKYYSKKLGEFQKK